MTRRACGRASAAGGALGTKKCESIARRGSSCAILSVVDMGSVLIGVCWEVDSEVPTEDAVEEESELHAPELKVAGEPSASHSPATPTH